MDDAEAVAGPEQREEETGIGDRVRRDRDDLLRGEKNVKMNEGRCDIG